MPKHELCQVSEFPRVPKKRTRGALPRKLWRGSRSRAYQLSSMPSVPKTPRSFPKGAATFGWRTLSMGLASGLRRDQLQRRCLVVKTGRIGFAFATAHAFAQRGFDASDHSARRPLPYLSNEQLPGQPPFRLQDQPVFPWRT